ncbi:MAG TPA: ComEA family DNA-binding protein [Candidatus Hydrogenedentes bacterium]|nr:ComEA family DNA-binding protein [Candidatus Hydrogenedentota bacterium]
MLSRMLTRKEQGVLLAVAGAIALGSVVIYFFSAERTDALPERETPASRIAVETAPPFPAAVSPSSTPSPSAPPSMEPPGPAATTESLAPPPVTPSASRTLVAAINGAVHVPGVYEFRGSARVKDLIDRAGGVREAADLSDINLAAPLIDGTTLVIPEAAGAAQRGGRVAIADGRGGVALNPPAYRISGWQPANASAPQDDAGLREPSRLHDAAGESKSSGSINVNTATAEELEALPGIGPKLAGEIVRYRAQSPFRAVDDLDNVPGIGAKRLETLRPFVCVQ